MVLIDIILSVVFVGFIGLGLSVGFGKMLSSIVGSLLGLFVAVVFSAAAFASYGHLVGGGNFGKIAIFVILFILTGKVVGIVFWLLAGFLRTVAWSPMAGALDKLLGGLLGLAEALIALGGILYFSTQHIPSTVLLPILESSSVSGLLIALASAVSAFGPESFSSAVKTFEAAKNSISDPDAIFNEVKNQIETGKNLYQNIPGSSDWQF